MSARTFAEGSTQTLAKACPKVSHCAYSSQTHFSGLSKVLDGVVRSFNCFVGLWLMALIFFFFF